jgi:hypothetical protein
MIYKKQNAVPGIHTEYKLSINTTDTNITYEYFLKNPWSESHPDKSFWTETPVYSRTCTYDEFKVDHSTHQKPQDAHILYGFFDRYQKDTYKHYIQNLKTGESIENLEIRGKVPVLLDIFKYTKDSKAALGSVIQTIDGPSLFLVAIPFKDSLVKDWVFITEAEETYFNGSLVTETIDIDYKKSLKDLSDKFLPNIKLSKEGNEITATLVPAKANVEVYFETTVGSLSAQRSFTDNNGQAKTTITSNVSGKVKVGFKHFSGKDEILV